MSAPEDRSRTTDSTDDRSPDHNPQQRVADQSWRARTWYAIKRSRNALWLFVISAAVLYAIVQQQAQSDDVASLAKDNAVTLTAVQDERVRNVREGCESTNARHDNAIDAVNRLTLKTLTGKEAQRELPAQQIEVMLKAALAKASKAERDRTEQQLANTLIIFDSFLPKRNCDRVVAEQLPSASVTPVPTATGAG